MLDTSGIEEKRHALAALSPSNSHEVERRGNFLVSTDSAILDLTLIHDFLCNHSYWAAGRPLEVVRTAIENSLCFGLYEEGRQVGFARVVTDRELCALCGDFFFNNCEKR